MTSKAADPGPTTIPARNFGHRHTPRSQHFSGLLPGGQVHGSGFTGLQTAQVDDSAHSGICCSVPYMGRRMAIEFRKSLPAAIEWIR